MAPEPPPPLPQKKQVVRRLELDRLADVDEPLSPFTLVLFVASGGLAGYIISLNQFDNPDPLHNTWTHLAALGGVVFLLIVGASFLRRRSQRRLEMGVFLSLLFHAALLFTGRNVYLKYFAPPPEPSAAVIDDEAPVTIPVYLPMQLPGETSAEMVRPVETETRDNRRLEVAPKTPEEVRAEKEAIQAPDPRQQPTPTPVELARVELTAPRRAEIPAGEKLSRQEMLEKLRTENVPKQQQAREAELQAQADAQQTTAERRENAQTPERRMQSNQPSPQNRPRPDMAAPQPTRASAADQLAAADTRADLRRMLTEAMNAQAPTAEAQVPRAMSQSSNQPSLDAAAAGPQRAATADAVARTAPTSTPLITVAPAPNATAAQLSRAETPEPSPSANPTPAPARPMQTASGGSNAGFESVPIESPTASASQNPTAAGGEAVSAPATAVERGDQGTPQSLLSQGMNQPSPLGQGSGVTVGSTSVGPRRNTSDAGDQTGLAASGTVFGRPGRGRTSGNAVIATPGPVAMGGAMAGAPGAAPRAGNALDGAPLGLQPAASSGGASLGERTAAVPGSMLRPSNGVGGLSLGPAGGGGGTTGSASGGSLSNTGGSGVGGPRRDGGAADVAGPVGGAAAGRSRSRLSSGDALASLPGDGMIAVGATQGAGRTDTGAAAPQGIDAVAGTAGMRREAGGLPVLIAAPAGPGGLSSRPARDIGLPSRRARPESEVVHLDTSRLVPERLGGKLSGGGQVRDTAVVGLKQRDPTARGEIAKTMGGSEETEQAVEMGLDFLARHQSPDGSWRLHDFGNGKPGYADAGLATVEADTAGTGLALLAFLGAGYTHHDAKYGDVIERGLTFLLKNQKPNGDLYVPPRRNPDASNTWFYSHGIASIALCEALGMTRDDDLLRKPAQRAIDFIVQSQDPQFGGWRYLPNIGSDTSVSGWQLMALKSAERVGLTVPPATYVGVEKWLNFSQGAGGDPTRYAYRPQSTASEPSEDRLPNRVMTAEALLMRQYLGWTRGDKNLVGGANYLLTQLPALGTPQRTERNSYYWYYATQVMFHMKGDHWKQWNDRLRPLLVDYQVRQGELAGSWDPRSPVPDVWGAAGGRIYLTTINLLILEVYYRYLPLYQNLEE